MSRRDWMHIAGANVAAVLYALGIAYVFGACDGCGGRDNVRAVAPQGSVCDPCPGYDKRQSGPPGTVAAELGQFTCYATPRCSALWFSTDDAPAECDKAAADWKAAIASPYFAECICNSRCAGPFPCPGCPCHDCDGGAP